MKYYVFMFWDRSGSGRHYVLATSEEDATKRLRQILQRRHPFRHFAIKLEQVMPA